MNRALKITVALMVVLCLTGGMILATISYMNDSNRQLPLDLFKENENSLDGVIIGTSSANRFWVSTEAYENHGAAIEVYASHSLPLITYRYMIEEVMARQNPEFIAIEIRNISQNPETRKTRAITDLTDHMPATMTRLRLIKRVMEYDEANDTEISDDPRAFRYPEAEQAVMKSEKYRLKSSIYKGFYTNASSFRETTFRNSTEWTEKTGKLPYDTEDTLNELMDYCETLDCDVIFFASPCVLIPERQKVVNKALEMAGERGFMTHNFNLDDERGLSQLSEQDFYNERHTNVYGAMKFTEYMYQYLDEIYDFEDHRGDDSYESWETASEMFRNYVRTENPDASFDVEK